MRNLKHALLTMMLYLIPVTSYMSRTSSYFWAQRSLIAFISNTEIQ